MCEWRKFIFVIFDAGEARELRSNALKAIFSARGNFDSHLIK